MLASLLDELYYLFVPSSSPENLLSVMDKCKQSRYFMVIAMGIYSKYPHIRVGSAGKKFRNILRFSNVPELLNVLSFPDWEVVQSIPECRIDVTSVTDFCYVCDDGHPDMLFLCGHVCFCYTCSPIVTKCPICCKTGQRLRVLS